jgi:hypothetical protein
LKLEYIHVVPVMICHQIQVTGRYKTLMKPLEDVTREAIT